MYKSKVRTRNVKEVVEETDKRKPMRLRVKRRKHRVVVLGIFACVLFAVCAGAFFGARHAYFAVQTLTVSGADAVDPLMIEQEVRAQLFDERFHMLPPSNLLLVPRRSIIESLLYTHPRLDSVAVSIASWSERTLAVTVVERIAVGQWCPHEIENGTCFLFDEGGFLFAPASLEYNDSLVKFEGALVYDVETKDGQAPLRAHFVPNDIELILSANELVRGAGFTPIQVRADARDIFVETQEGTELRLTLSQTLDETRINLLSALASDELKNVRDTLAYIDVRFGERIYYRFRD